MFRASPSPTLRPKRLTIRERLELFIKVCEAFNTPIRKAVIHRDLKPANILVSRWMANRCLASSTSGWQTASPQLDGETLITQAGNWVAHRVYESGASRSNRDGCGYTHRRLLAGRSVYVLLTGCRTLTPKNQRFDEFLRWLREEIRRVPAPRVSAVKPTSQVTAEARGGLNPDVDQHAERRSDWITMKALEEKTAHGATAPRWNWRMTSNVIWATKL